MLLQLQAIADSLVKTKIQQNEHVSDIKDADHLDKIELQNIHNFATIKRFIRAKNKKEELCRNESKKASGCFNSCLPDGRALRHG